MILISACLAGIPCRYDGSAATNSDMVKLLQSGEAIAVCPEELGGLTTPRSPSQFHGGTGEDVLDRKARLISLDGRDVTKNFIAGAKAVLRIARELNLSKAVMKAKSPSCGKGTVYRGKSLTKGNGVCTALLLRHGFKVETRGN